MEADSKIGLDAARCDVLTICISLMKKGQPDQLFKCYCRCDYYLKSRQVPLDRALHTLMHTYEKAACQVKKLYYLTSRGPQTGLIAKHLSVFTQRCHTIMYLINGVPITLPASAFVGHVH
jgi:hypothetical protein